MSVKEAAYLLGYTGTAKFSLCLQSLVRGSALTVMTLLAATRLFAVEDRRSLSTITCPIEAAIIPKPSEDPDRPSAVRRLCWRQCAAGEPDHPGIPFVMPHQGNRAKSFMTFAR
jgi:hypothetical protein